VDKDIQQDLKANNLFLNEAIYVAQNRSLWRLMSAFDCEQHKLSINLLMKTVVTSN